MGGFPRPRSWLLRREPRAAELPPVRTRSAGDGGKRGRRGGGQRRHLPQPRALRGPPAPPKLSPRFPGVSRSLVPLPGTSPSPPPRDIGFVFPTSEFGKPGGLSRHRAPVPLAPPVPSPVRAAPTKSFSVKEAEEDGEERERYRVLPGTANPSGRAAGCERDFQVFRREPRRVIAGFGLPAP